jgi:3-hydroxyisobutyrate dehydrogenase
VARKLGYAPAPMAKLAFIGLGTIGGPIARHLAAAGHDMTVYNRTPAKAEAWVNEHGGRMATSAQEAADGADGVFSCVGTDDDVADVTLGAQGCFRAMRPGAFYVDHTTVSAKIARQLGVEGKDRGFHVLDAPVTGGERGAKEGRLALMCGGPKKAFEAAEPLMHAYARIIVHMGAAGTGQTTKMVNQIALAASAQGVAEAMRFAQAAKLDLDKVFQAISTGAASSWQMTNRWETMAKDEFGGGLTIDWFRKDLGLAIDEARTNHAQLPLTALVDQFYAEVQKMGGGKQDTSAIIRRFQK